jgi:hypothetical protein
MLLEVQGIQHQFKPEEMHFYGILWSNSWIYCFKGR